MKCYEFGNEENPTIMLLPGTCCHWKNNFGNVINQLAKDFFVVAVSYDGFDETENSEFPDMLTETKKIEDYIIKKFHGRIHTVYGCSLGGSFVGLMVQRQRIHMNHGILGSSDLDHSTKWSAKFQTMTFTPIAYKMIHTGKMPKFMEKKMLSKYGEEYTRKGFDLLGIGSDRMAFVTKKSVKNQYYSDLVTGLKEKIEVPGTKIHCFYAQKMGSQYLERYQKYFKNPHIVQCNMQHEELLVCHPEKWCQTVKKCILQ